MAEHRYDALDDRLYDLGAADDWRERRRMFDELVAAMLADAHGAGKREGAAEVRARVEAVCKRIDRHTEREPDAVEFRDGDTGVWWDVTDTIRAALNDGSN